MDEEAMHEVASNWEPVGSEVVRTIDTYSSCCERIIKYQTEAGEWMYSMYRYFTLGDCTCKIHVSVDLDSVDADEMIQYLGERL